MTDSMTETVRGLATLATRVDTESWIKQAIIKMKDSTAIEKSEMQRLNRELKSYLDKVKALENLNATLMQQVQEARNRAMPKVVDKTDFDKQLSEARKRIGDEANDCAKYEAIYAKNKDEIAYLNGRIKFQQNEIELQNKLLTQLNGELAQFGNQKQALLNGQKHTEQEIVKEKEKIARAEEELKKLNQSLKESRSNNKKLEFEIQTLEEELTFAKAVREEELNQLNAQAPEILTGGVDSNAFYRNELNNCVIQIRQDFHELNEKQIRDLREMKESEYLLLKEQAEYEKKLADELKAKNEDNLDAKSLDELRRAVEMDKNELGKLRADHSKLLARLEKLQLHMDDSRVRNQSELRIRISDAERLREQNRAIAGELEYWDRVTRTKLESEIQTYRSILNSQLKFFNDSSSSSTIISGGSSYTNTNTNRPTEVLINGATNNNNNNNTNGTGGSGGGASTTTIINAATNNNNQPTTTTTTTNTTTLVNTVTIGAATNGGNRPPTLQQQQSKSDSIARKKNTHLHNTTRNRVFFI